jgi:FKBP-type peptidyl-prolyl cis-trans isomerase (trigger factor)
MKTKKEKRKNAEVVVSGALPKEEIEKATEKTLLSIQKELHLPGFRKGTAPLGHVRAHVGEKALWREAAERVLRNSVEEILKENEVVPVMPVSIGLGSKDDPAGGGASGTDMPFEIVAVVSPTCSIENYKQTAEKALKKLDPLDFEKAKEEALASMRAQSRQMVASTMPTSSSADTPLSDDEAKKLGFENSAAVELFIRDEAEKAVKDRDNQRKRSAIAEALIEKAACDLPRALIHQEASQLLEATKRDVAGQGMLFNEYLKRRGKTEADILAELESPAEKRVCLDLIFAEIARAEKIEADSKEEERLAHALVGQGVDHDTAHRYVRATVMREKVWEILGAPAVSKIPEPNP